MSFFSIKAFLKPKLLCFISIFILGTVFLNAENFRIHRLISINLTEINQKLSVESGINDAVFVTLPEDLTYVSGIELNFKIPEIIATWRDSVAYMLYENLTPQPSEKSNNYFGERLHISTLPGKLSLTLYIPVSDDFSIKSNPYSEKLPKIKNINNGIFLRFMMVMKGVPESLEDSILEITAKPVLKNQGSLSLSVNTPPSESETSQKDKKYSVFIDDTPVQTADLKNKILSTGEHHLSIVSDSYRNELRTFRIEQAKTTSLLVNLRGIEPLLKILSPKDTQIFLDGEKLSTTNDLIPITQGDHTVKFILGDYEIVKNISALNGHTYSVNLNIDATISEEE
ncbi:hypothetical protein [Treponema sp.]|uniref:hypothetical protein n=1 Tax=Treponema sp. TaxID=166 RepID=UPI00388E048A